MPDNDRMRLYLLLVVVVTLLSVPLVLVANTSSPVPGRAGGFGGPTCHACHQDNALNAPGGDVTISGLPERYTAGETYRVRVSLQRPELQRGGFSLAARFATGALARTQAGEWQSSDSRIAFYPDAMTAVRYVQHSATGTNASAPGSIVWELDWKAPQEKEAVQFNFAATASNADGSPLGDFVYAREVTVPPASR